MIWTKRKAGSSACFPKVRKMKIELFFGIVVLYLVLAQNRHNYLSTSIPLVYNPIYYLHSTSIALEITSLPLQEIICSLEEDTNNQHANKRSRTEFTQDRRLGKRIKAKMCNFSDLKSLYILAASEANSSKLLWKWANITSF